ncbi:MAG: leucine-rich repeat-containing protein kinase family protein [Cyanobacteria bacterium P01_F01_bin.53]
MSSIETLNALKSGQLAGTKKLNLSCGLTEFPREILELSDSLEILELSGNRFSALPDDFGRLKKLKIAFFNNNAFETFPTVLADCPALSMISFKGNQISTLEEQALSPAIRWLILTNNKLKSLPTSIGRLTKLQKLMLAGNQLQELPEEMSACKNLALIRLSANQLQALPNWLFSLPKLSWLAYAGNPFCNTLSSTPTDTNAISPNAVNPLASHRKELPVIEFANLQKGEVLGEGASGVIYKGLWTDPTTSAPVDVAIKIFKGDITSDGLPHDEMRACIAAGEHPNLVTVLGKLGSLLEGQTDANAVETGLVFSFVPPAFTNLGNPPSLETCTRDTYSADTRFTLPMILQIAQGIASAAAHLHANGIMHGDLYAHNILINATGQSFLGDFGAASFYDSGDRTLAQSLERLEVSAFGCLLEDLLDHYAPTSQQDPQEAIEHLRCLQQDCLQPEPSLRPLFSSICTSLATI